ncbi:MAG: Rieske 2Fe-2S domain-containing protein, partial [Pusillimonas sp.]
MLSREDNDILTQTDAGTPLGDLMRRFWIPALLSEEVAEPDGAPRRFRLLGEDLIAFRNTDGVVGVMEEACPHRRASLALGVNAENGVRCLYHGWKFDVNGECVDTPAEPPGFSMVGKVRAKAYPAREAAGVIWAYMGPAAEEPIFPDFEMLGFPKGHVAAFKMLEECNYAQ